MALVFKNGFFHRISETDVLKVKQQGQAYLQYNFSNKKWESCPSESPAKDPAVDPKVRLEIQKNWAGIHDKKWIRLSKKSDQWVQEGPFSSLDIFEGLQNSTIRFSDAIWTAGFSRWISIEKVKNFECLRHWDESPPIDAADLLANVIEMHRVENQKPTQIPDDNLFIILDEKSF